MCALQLHVIAGFSPARGKVRQPHSLHDLAVEVVTFSNQQIRDSARIVEIGSHNPRGNNGHALAVESRADVGSRTPEMELEIQWQEHELGEYPVIVLTWEDGMRDARGNISRIARTP
jgi:hypothetical protein